MGRGVLVLDLSQGHHAAKRGSHNNKRVVDASRPAACGFIYWTGRHVENPSLTQIGSPQPSPSCRTKVNFARGCSRLAICLDTPVKAC